MQVLPSSGLKVNTQGLLAYSLYLENHWSQEYCEVSVFVQTKHFKKNTLFPREFHIQQAQTEQRIWLHHIDFCKPWQLKEIVESSAACFRAEDSRLAPRGHTRHILGGCWRWTAESRRLCSEAHPCSFHSRQAGTACQNRSLSGPRPGIRFP